MNSLIKNSNASLKNLRDLNVHITCCRISICLPVNVANLSISTQSYRSLNASLIFLLTSKMTFVNYPHLTGRFTGILSLISVMHVKYKLFVLKNKLHIDIFTLYTISDAIFCRGIIRNKHYRYIYIF